VLDVGCWSLEIGELGDVEEETRDECRNVEKRRDE